MMRTISKLAALTAVVFLGCSLVTAQEPKQKNPAEDMAAVKTMLQDMSGQVKIAEVPEEQRATPAQIDRLFEAMKFHEQLAQTMDLASKAMKSAMQQVIEQKKNADPNAAQMTPEHQEQFNALMAEYMKRLADVIYSDEVLGPMKAAYRRYLSAEDVEGIIAFYSSAPGQHLLDRQVKIQLEAAPAMMDAIQTKMQGLIQEMMKRAAAMQPPDKKSPAAAKKPAPKQ